MAGRLSGVSVLVVEDDPDSRILLKDFLFDAGADCRIAGSGNQGFQFFRTHHADVVVSDLWMPDGDGFELIRRIRALAPEEGGLTPAIAISGGVAAEEALMAGFHVLIPKPFEFDKIAELVEDFVRPKPQTDAAATPPWALVVSTPGNLLLTFSGYVRVEDIRACMDALLSLLALGPSVITVDLHQLTGFSLAVASFAERAIWKQRSAIKRVVVKGGHKAARLVVASTCRILGIACALERG